MTMFITRNVPLEKKPLLHPASVLFSDSEEKDCDRPVTDLNTYTNVMYCVILFCFLRILYNSVLGHLTHMCSVW